MSVKSSLIKIRNKFFLNAIRSSVTEIVRGEIGKAVCLIQKNSIHGGVTDLVHSHDGAENRLGLFHHRLLASPNPAQHEHGGAFVYVAHTDR